jgi:tetratricopeptide (TPR) repeat protein
VLSRVRPSLLADGEPLPGLRLADYLEQVLSRKRAQVRPPDEFWLAAERFAASARDLVALVSAALARGRTEAAERLARRAASLGEPRGLQLVGEYIEQERPERDPLPFYESAAQAGDSFAQVKLAWLYEQADRIDEAEQWYRAAIDSEEGAHARVGLASVLWTRGEHEAAMDLYEQALADGHARAVEYQARHLAKQGDHELALELTRRSFEAGNTEAFTGLAWRYMYSDHERAIEILRQAILAYDFNALREMAWVMEEDGKPEVAQFFCDLAVKCGEINTLRGLGMIRAGKGDLESARGLFWHAYNAGSPWVLPQIAELYERNGDLRRAERIYRRCIDDRTCHPTAVSGLVRIYEKTGRHEQAETLAVTSPEHAVPDLARLRAERGERDGAERLLGALVNAGHLGALVHIARIREHAGDISGAELMLRRARDAGVRGAQRTLKDLHQQRVTAEGRPGNVPTQLPSDVA